MKDEYKVANDENTIEQESAVITVQHEHEQQNKNSFLYSQQLLGYPKAKKEKENAKAEEEETA